MHLRSRVAACSTCRCCGAWPGMSAHPGRARSALLPVAGGGHLYRWWRIAALLITLVEKPWNLRVVRGLVLLGPDHDLRPGRLGLRQDTRRLAISWLLILFGVAMLGTITGALVAAVIDFLLKEGQGMGAAGYRDHIVVCGWNATARDIIQELQGRRVPQASIVHHPRHGSNPAGERHVLREGRSDRVTDLRRAGIEEASRRSSSADRRLQRRRHARHPGGHGHRDRGPGRAHRGRDQQRPPCGALPARPCGRDPGHLQPSPRTCWPARPSIPA